MHRRFLLLAGAAALGLGATLAVRAQVVPNGRPCAIKPSAVLGPQGPADVCIPDGFSGIAVEYFDDYSWRAFVSLVWPTAPPRRGAPVVAATVTGAGSRVFETFKPLWEIFHRDGSDPEPRFDQYDTAAHNPCGVSSRFGDVVIGSHSGIDDIGQAGIGMLDAPVVAQNGRYIRTLTAFNQTAFDFIVGHRYYLRSALPAIPTPRPDRPVMDFPDGSIAVKSAWVDTAGLNPALVKRMYTRQALVKRAAGAGCDSVTVGLLGLHIAQKTPSRPQWIWSTFEQKDLVPPAWPDTPDAFVLNDGKSPSMPARNPLSLVPLAPEPVVPFSVVRAADAPILTRTELASFGYQDALAGSPFRFYRLVMTQWPRLEGNQADPIPATVDGSIAHSFPGEGAISAFANLTMETFNQHGPQVGCMSCHNRARMGADFMWTLLDHAYPARIGTAQTASR